MSIEQDNRKLVGECFARYCRDQALEFPISAFASLLARDIPGARVSEIYRSSGAQEEMVYFTVEREASPQRYWLVTLSNDNLLLPCPIRKNKFDDGNTPQGFYFGSPADFSPESLKEVWPAILSWNSHRWEVRAFGGINVNPRTKPAIPRSSAAATDRTATTTPRQPAPRQPLPATSTNVVETKTDRTKPPILPQAATGLSRNRGLVRVAAIHTPPISEHSVEAPTEEEFAKIERKIADTFVEFFDEISGKSRTDCRQVFISKLKSIGIEVRIHDLFEGSLAWNSTAFVFRSEPERYFGKGAALRKRQFWHLEVKGKSLLLPCLEHFEDSSDAPNEMKTTHRIPRLVPRKQCSVEFELAGDEKSRIVF